MAYLYTVHYDYRPRRPHLKHGTKITKWKEVMAFSAPHDVTPCAPDMQLMSASAKATGGNLLMILYGKSL